VYTELKNKEK